MRFLSFLFCWTLAAQTFTVSGPTEVRVGQAVTFTLGFSAGTASVSGFQFESPAQPWVSLLSTKTVTCNSVNSRCILIGENNADTISSSNVATVNWVIPAVIPVSVSLFNIIATTPTGDAATISGVVPLNLFLFGDVNGDRQLTRADVDAAKDQSLGKAPCNTGDVNKDGVCTVRDVQIVSNEVRAAGG